MKSTSCIKKDVKNAVCYTKRRITYPGNIKFNNIIFFHDNLKKHESDDVLIVKVDDDHLHVYDIKENFICTARKFHTLPKPKRKAVNKVPNKKPRAMEIHENLERIEDGKLSDMGLFQLSMKALMPYDVYRELKRRIELIQKHLNICQETITVKIYKASFDAALDIVRSLTENPQEKRR